MIDWMFTKNWLDIDNNTVLSFLKDEKTEDYADYYYEFWFYLKIRINFLSKIKPIKRVIIMEKEDEEMQNTIMIIILAQQRNL